MQFYLPAIRFAGARVFILNCNKLFWKLFKICWLFFFAKCFDRMQRITIHLHALCAHYIKCVSLKLFWCRVAMQKWQPARLSSYNEKIKMFNAKWKLLALVLDAIAPIQEVFSPDVLLLNMQITDFLWIVLPHMKNHSCQRISLLCHSWVCNAMQCFVNEQQSSHILRYPLAINHLKCIQSVSPIDFFTAFIGNLLQFYK